MIHHKKVYFFPKLFYIQLSDELYEDYLLVLGDMGELGEKEESYHKELGEYIFKKNSKARVLTVGNLSENISRECGGKHFSDISQVVEYIKNNISKSTRIFLKASRSMKFENIISLLS